jgi:hypothetical protein
MNFFKRWNDNLPDDVDFYKKMEEMRDKMAAEKQALIDAADISHTGKTQAQHAADAPKLEMTLTDEDGVEVASVPVL